MKKIKTLLFKDYLNSNCEKIILLHKNINTRGSKFLNIFRKRKYNKLLFKNNCFIPLTAKFGENIIFPHGVCGIYISGRSIIGNNCTIFQQVTIGSNTLKDSKNQGSPIIGNNVYIGAGAKIIGNVRVGNNVRIGANAVVVKDIPDNCTVVNSDIRIIQHNEPRDNTFIMMK